MENNVIPIERGIMNKQGRPRNSVVPKGSLIKEARLRYESNREKFARGLKHSMSPVTVARIEQSKASSPNKIKQVIEPLGLKYEDVIEINAGSPDYDIRELTVGKWSILSEPVRCEHLGSADLRTIATSYKHWRQSISHFNDFAQELTQPDEPPTLSFFKKLNGIPDHLIICRSFIEESEKTAELKVALERLDRALIETLENFSVSPRTADSIISAYDTVAPLQEQLSELEELGVAVKVATIDQYRGADFSELLWLDGYRKREALKAHERLAAEGLAVNRAYIRWPTLAVILDKKNRLNQTVYARMPSGARIAYDESEPIRNPDTNLSDKEWTLLDRIWQVSPYSYWGAMWFKHTNRVAWALVPTHESIRF